MYYYKEQFNGFPAHVYVYERWTFWPFMACYHQLETIDTHLYAAVVGLAGLENRGGNGASVKRWNVVRASSKAAGSWLTSGRDTEKVLLLRSFFFWAATILAAIAATRKYFSIAQWTLLLASLEQPCPQVSKTLSQTVDHTCSWECFPIRAHQLHSQLTRINSSSSGVPWLR